MKKVFLFLAAAIAFAACKSPMIDDIEDGENPTVQTKKKKFTFTIKGDFVGNTFSRAYLTADGSEMTDLWLFDYMNGTCVQALHRTNTDADWGSPQLSLAYGSHHVYFVASRGTEPSLDAETHSIVWGTPRDCFWKDYQVEVVSTSNGNRAVTLDRVATKLKVTVLDEVPDGIATVTLTPERWFYGLDYLNGSAVTPKKKERPISVPENYIGTSGTLACTIFGLSGSDEWTTSFTITATDGSGNTLGSATVEDAAFKRNRVTEYSGNLFGSSSAMGVTLNAEWDTPVTGTW